MKKDMAEMKNLIAGIMRGEVPVAQPKAHGDYTPTEVHTPSAHPTTLAGRDDYRNVLSSPSGYAPVEDVVEIPATPHATSHHAEVSDFEEQPLSLEEAERSLIQAALIRHDGRRRRAAQDLKISERTLYRKIKEYGLEE
jgi:sigma-54 dependent transcriptional regulator